MKKRLEVLKEDLFKMVLISSGGHGWPRYTNDYRSNLDIMYNYKKSMPSFIVHALFLLGLSETDKSYGQHTVLTLAMSLNNDEGANLIWDHYRKCQKKKEIQWTVKKFYVILRQIEAKLTETRVYSN